MTNTFLTQRHIVSPTANSFFFNTKNPNGVDDVQAVFNDGKIELHVLEDKALFGSGPASWSSGYTQIYGVIAPGWNGPLHQTGSGGPVTHAIAEVPEPPVWVVPPVFTRVIVLSDGRVTWHVYLVGIAK